MLLIQMSQTMENQVKQNRSYERMLINQIFQSKNIQLKIVHKKQQHQTSSEQTLSHHSSNRT